MKYTAHSQTSIYAVFEANIYEEYIIRSSVRLMNVFDYHYYSTVCTFIMYFQKKSV